MEIVSSYISPGTLGLLVLVLLLYRNPWLIEAMHAMGNEYNSQYVDDEELEKEDPKRK